MHTVCSALLLLDGRASCRLYVIGLVSPIKCGQAGLSLPVCIHVLAPGQLTCSTPTPKKGFDYGHYLSCTCRSAPR